jgi:hypothetical protein
LIGSSGEHVRRGVQLVNKAGASLADIVGGVKRVADIVAEIAAANQEQSTGVAEVENTVGLMEQVTQKNAQLVEESSNALSAVDQQTEELAALVHFFKVSGQRDLPVYAPAPKARDERPRANARGLQSKLTQALGAGVASADEGSAAPAAAEPRPVAPGPLRRAQMSTGTSGESWDEF